MPGLEFLLLITIVFLSMISPGPDFILVTRNAITQPRAQALATAFGIVSGCIVHATYCMLGLAFVITQSILLYSTLKYLGAAYLIYIGVKSLLAPKQEQKNAPMPAREISVRTAFMQGFLCNVLNPKLAVFLLSLFTQFITPAAPMGQKAIVTGVFFVESAIYWPLLVLAVQMPMIRSRLQAMQGAINKLCGAVLIAFGARVALSRN